MAGLGQRLRRGDHLVQAAVALWIVTMIATPIVRWAAGDGALALMASLGVLVQSAAVATIFLRSAGLASTVRALLPLLAAAWLIEFIGSRTGLPFGRYSYTSTLQPQAGGVPLIVPLAWMMMLPPSWAVADSILRRGGISWIASARIWRAILAALAFTAWDLALDPQMTAWGFWRWPGGGPYFGIPLTNYLGWLLISFLISLLLFPRELPLKPLLAVYGVMWFLQSFGLALFWGLPGPALCGFLAMGGFLAWALMRSR
jgi:putative membrane protein